MKTEKAKSLKVVPERMTAQTAYDTLKKLTATPALTYALTMLKNYLDRRVRQVKAAASKAGTKKAKKAA